MSIRIILIGSISMTSFLVGCEGSKVDRGLDDTSGSGGKSTGGGASGGNAGDGGMGGTVNAGEGGAFLETLAGEPGDCDKELTEATACEWVEAADYVALGTITALNLDASTMVAVGGEAPGWSFVSECRLLTRALRVDIEVQEAYKGDLVSTLTFWIGGRQIKSFEPILIDTGGPMPTWEKSSGKTREGLAIGQKILVGLHAMANGSLSLMGEPILGVHDSGVIDAKKNSGDCLNSVPSELDGDAIDSLNNTLHNCAPDFETKARLRQAQRHMSWDTVPFQTYAVECNDGGPEIPPNESVDEGDVGERPIEGQAGTPPGGHTEN